MAIFEIACAAARKGSRIRRARRDTPSHAPTATAGIAPATNPATSLPSVAARFRSSVPSRTMRTAAAATAVGGGKKSCPANVHRPAASHADRIVTAITIRAPRGSSCRLRQAHPGLVLENPPDPPLRSRRLPSGRRPRAGADAPEGWRSPLRTRRASGQHDHPVSQQNRLLEIMGHEDDRAARSRPEGEAAPRGAGDASGNPPKRTARRGGSAWGSRRRARGRARPSAAFPRRAGAGTRGRTLETEGPEDFFGPAVAGRRAPRRAASRPNATLSTIVSHGKSPWSWKTRAVSGPLVSGSRNALDASPRRVRSPASLQERRLPAPGRADDGDDFAVPDAERHSSQRRHDSAGTRKSTPTSWQTRRTATSRAPAAGDWLRRGARCR